MTSSSISPVWYGDSYTSASSRIDLVERMSSPSRRFFHDLVLGKRWCEAGVSSQIRSGVSPSEATAVLIRGRWAPSPGDDRTPRWEPDEPLLYYICHPESGSERFLWHLHADFEVWLAEITQTPIVGRVKAEVYARPAEQGGPHFTDLHTAKQWCQTRLIELIGAGANAADLEAYIQRGYWDHDDDAGEPVWVEDDHDGPYHVGRSDPNRDTFTWVTGPHPYPDPIDTGGIP